MKIRFILLFLSFTICGVSMAQVSVGSRHIGKSSKLKKGAHAMFKKSETIFVLSNTLKKEDYEAILKDAWKVTPYQIVSYDDFDPSLYFGNYSIARIGGFKRIKKDMKTGVSRVTSLHTFVDVEMYDGAEIKEKLNKLSAKKRAKKFNDVIDDNTIALARFYLSPKDEFIVTAISKDMSEVVQSLYNEDVFHNYSPGLLRNYFQKVSNLLEIGDPYWMYEDDYLPELKELKGKKLYVPDYVGVKYNGWTLEDSEAENSNIEAVFKKYEYDYEIISQDDLSDRIMNNELFYYFRFARTNTERFIQIVNAQTGEIVYRNYVPGLSYKLKPKHLASLSKKIKKANK